MTVQGSAVSTQIEALSESTYLSIGPTTSAGIPLLNSSDRHTLAPQACQSGTVHSTPINGLDFYQI
ncbi:hypothetical protein GCM10023334_121730 [Nonomuraea thailandensis]